MKPLSTLIFALLSISLNASINLPTSFNTNFEQTITNDKGKTIEYKGSVYFQNVKESIADDRGLEQSYTRSLFKWNYSMPTKKEVCTDGIQLTVVDHDLEQISNYLIDEGIDLESILNVATQITAKDYKAIYKEVEYLISLDDKNQLSKIIYVDNLDNNVKIVFSNMLYNKKLDTKLLECHAPQEYDVIKG